MLTKINNRIVKVLSFIAMLSMVFLTAIVAIQVFSRWMGISLPWTEELARFVLIWLTFIGSSLALEKKMHLSVKFFVNLLPDKIRYYVRLFIYALMMVFFGVIVFYGFKLTILSFGTLSSSLQWPMGIVYSILPITSIISIFFIAMEFIEVYKDGGVRA